MRLAIDWRIANTAFIVTTTTKIISASSMRRVYWIYDTYKSCFDGIKCQIQLKTKIKRGFSSLFSLLRPSYSRHISCEGCKWFYKLPPREIRWDILRRKKRIGNAVVHVVWIFVWRWQLAIDRNSKVCLAVYSYEVFIKYGTIWHTFTSCFILHWLELLSNAGSHFLITSSKSCAPMRMALKKIQCTIYHSKREHK